MSKDQPHNRLGLAGSSFRTRTRSRRASPSTAFWQQVFGAGIVRSAEGFGSRGEPPTHPELLDWLALEFRGSDWNVKQLFRLMVTSATYRGRRLDAGEDRSGPGKPAALSRGPRFRMDGEMLRDMALDAGGLLAEIGSPSVHPYQPDNIWETVAMKSSNTRFYHQDKGDNLYRRSLYTFWKHAPRHLRT
ncbi:MAG: DUF1553 domain-containing protein [Bryobacterales bacterium]